MACACTYFRARPGMAHGSSARALLKLSSRDGAIGVDELEKPDTLVVATLKG
jgi:hypothetical protein